MSPTVYILLVLVCSLCAGMLVGKFLRFKTPEGNVLPRYFKIGLFWGLLSPALFLALYCRALWRGNIQFPHYLPSALAWGILCGAPIVLIAVGTGLLVNKINSGRFRGEKPAGPPPPLP